MSGVGSMAVGAIDSHHSTSASLCVDAVVNIYKINCTRLPTILYSSFVGNCWSGKKPLLMARSKQQQRRRKSNGGGFGVFNQLGGVYEDGFEDVKLQIINYFTYKAVRTVLHQLYEMNPPKYTWFYNFVVANNPTDGKRFLRELGKEKQDLAERVMVTRLHLYGKWIKKCDHAEIYERISKENLELMRERLIETVIWPSDDSNTDKLGFD